MDKAMTAVLGGVLVFGMIMVFAGMAQAATPQPQFMCPICDEVFFTYDELYQHFTIEHPASPIDIIWE